MLGLRRLRHRMVLGPIVRYLDADEHIVAWTHANVPGVRSPAVLAVTNYHCLVHIASSSVADVSTPLRSLTGFKTNRRTEEVVRVRLIGEQGEVDVELSLTNRLRSRSVGRVLSTLTEHRIAAPPSFDPNLTSPIPPMVRRAKHHARRVWVTVLGVAVLLVSAAFASPFVPGPGALTAVAGFAILAREYEWARDVHVWVSRQVDRFLTWVRNRVRRPSTTRRLDTSGVGGRSGHDDVSV